MTSSGHDLVGAMDPVGGGIGFLVPLFSDRASNKLKTQLVDTKDAIAGFEELDAEIGTLLPAPSLRVQVGDNYVWSFAYSQNDIVFGSGRSGLEILRSRMADPVLKKYPLLEVEVAEFLQDSEMRTAAATRAYDKLAAASLDAADQWRDLSILTPDIREALLGEVPEKLRSQAARTLRRVVAHHSSSTLEIAVPRDIERWASFKLISAVAEKTKARLRPLFSKSSKNSIRLSFIAEGRRQQAPDEIPPYANLFIADEGGGSQRESFDRTVERGVRVFDPWDVDEFEHARRTSERTQFVWFNLSPALPGLPVTDLPSAPLVGLASRARGGARLSKSEEAALRRADAPVVIIPSPNRLSAIRRNLPPELHTATQVLSAMDRVGFSVGQIGQTCVMLRSHGSGPKPGDDALAQLYGRCWRLGLHHPRGAILEAPRRSEGSLQTGMSEIIFPDLPVLPLPPLDGPPRLREGDAAVLVAYEPQRSAEYWRDYAGVVQKALSAQGWDLSRPADSGPWVRAEIIGHYASMMLETSSEPVPGPVGLRFTEASDVNIDDVREIKATEDAGAASILESIIKRRQILLSLRDLVLFPPEGATVWSAISSQMRRFATTIPSRPRSNYFGMIIQSAVQRDWVGFDRMGDLLAVLHRHEYGHMAHIICTRVEYRPDGSALAHMKSSWPQRAFGPEMRFTIALSRNGPMIENEIQPIKPIHPQL